MSDTIPKPRVPRPEWLPKSVEHSWLPDPHRQLEWDYILRLEADNEGIEELRQWFKEYPTNDDDVMFNLAVELASVSELVKAAKDGHLKLKLENMKLRSDNLRLVEALETAACYCQWIGLSSTRFGKMCSRCATLDEVKEK